MHHVVDERLLQEAETFQLRATCEHCVYFVADAGTCSEGYPNQMHRTARKSVGDVVVYCKKFELW